VTSCNEKQGNDLVDPARLPGDDGSVRVTMTDSLGTIFLGVLATILLIGLLRSKERYRALAREAAGWATGSRREAFDGER
jgi:hypothetical protein